YWLTYARLATALRDLDAVRERYARVIDLEPSLVDAYDEWFRVESGVGDRARACSLHNQLAALTDAPPPRPAWCGQ
ncbi:MAG: hypothetical protein KC561_01535, partial [Myxococcales bacterium]|nr:hypothetical protein [Myxococcales bacterium]